jgi:hypothetical protein
MPMNRRDFLKVAAVIAAGAFAAGPVTVPIDTTASTFARVEVRDATGLLVAGSNPVWMLRTTPPAASPPHGSPDPTDAWRRTDGASEEPPSARLDRVVVLGNPAPRCTGCGCTERVTVGP